VAQRAVGQPLHRPPISSGEDHGDQQHHQQRQGHVADAERAQHQKRDHRDEGADHVDLAMGEIDHADDAVDHGVADGDEPIDRPQGQAIDELLQKIRHAPPTVSGCRTSGKAQMGRERRDSGRLIESRVRHIF
jgi:hypothetical protein